MGEEIVFNKINRLLATSGYNLNIKGLSDLKTFLRNKDNIKLEVYDEIEELYTALMLGPGMW